MIRSIDPRRPTLFMPDGSLATSWRLGPFRAELARLKIPGVEDASLGKSGLLNLYEARVTAVAEAMRSPAPAARRQPSPIGDAYMRKAADALAASALVDSLDAPPPRAPRHPIATTATR